MPISAVRDIAKGGVITDVDPYDLPLGSWSWGANVRFRNGSITRAPVFRSATAGLAEASPRFVGADFPSTGFDKIIVAYLNGKVSTIQNSVETDSSIASYTTANSEQPFTDCHLGDVYYVNRGDRKPWALMPTASQFVELANWAPVDGPWAANILRASNSALCAFGLTQGGTSYPNVIITSEFAQAGTVPTTWDYTLGTNNATRNNLGEMESHITDACALGNVMVIYGLSETWLMTLDGSSEIWSYRQLFGDQGAISANCAVAVDNKHYVFGLDDLWVHDGTSKQSLCDGRTREFIFSSLNVSKANRCRVVYNKNLKEVYFQYVSGDGFCAFTGADGANRQAVYHIPSNTWSFDDLPFVFGATMANLNIVQEWQGLTTPWSTIGGTWFDQSDSAKKVIVMLGDVAATYSLQEKLYAFDLNGPGSVVAYAIDTNATKGWTLQRDGIDLGQLGVDLRGYKLISSIYPQARLEAGAAPIDFQVGTADFFNQPATFGAVQTYDGASLYKLDYNLAGRYMSLNITHNDYRYVKLTGFDFDIDVTGEY